MARLGGSSITSADPRTSSAAKGETLADSARVISSYADIMVIRHPRDGAARLAAEYSSIPVINGGDGAHEHPTQTLCDLFTLKQKNKTLKNLTIAISGDLKGSRTIHSFVYALARFGANIALMPAQGMELPSHVDTRLREDFGRQRTQLGGDAAIDAWYIAPDEPHQLSLIPSPDLDDADMRTREKIEKIAQLIHFMYVTRFQKERSSDGKKQGYPKIDAKFLAAPRYSRTSVLHPLPRVDELDVSFDTDRRALYFQQAAYGVPIRMALISLLLGLRGKSLQKFDGGFERSSAAYYEQPIGLGIECQNANCIVHDEHEKRQAKNKFYVLQSTLAKTCKLRCVYCESDIEEAAARPLIVAQKSKGLFSRGHCAAAQGLAGTNEGFRDLRRARPTRQVADFSARPRPAANTCTPASAREPIRTMLHPINWSLALPYYAAALGVRLPARLDPVRAHPDAACGQPAIFARIGSGNIGATNVLRTGRKGLAAATLLGDALKGTRRGAPGLSLVRPRTWRFSPRSARFSATCFRSGSNSRAARGSPPISVC